MMQERERLYQLDKAISARDADSSTTPPGLTLPPGWIGLEQCNLSPVPGQFLVIPHVLLHPRLGVALVDIAPGETSGVEMALRARLEAARFGGIFPGELPVVHLQLDPSELDHLGTLLPQAFAELPPLDLPGGDGWVSMVRRALTSRALAPRRAPNPAAAPGPAAPPPLLNREVAAQRAGRAVPPAPQPYPRFTGPAAQASPRWLGLSLAMGLAGLAAVVAAAAVLWGGGSPPRQAAVPGIAAPDLTGTAPATPAPTTGGGPALPAAPPARMTELPASAGPPRSPAPAPRSPDPAPALRPDPAAPLAAAPPVPRPTAPLPNPPPDAAVPDPGPTLVLTASANLRVRPNNGATILRILRAGEVVHAFNRSADGWVEVGDTRPQGWVYGRYLAPARH
ncbi:SH3 domain-containing protein [Roseicella aquatilis]|uniref:SH3 domain-containing protein n=1 Tax=Roseicella aquatilis TaxID=2527868 RepID=A0A4R4D5U0_9PROT|nr:SH3 domain-containing protein [Roseicella aquatilis]TCZ52924.1 SH3 domain-containing protein [Roseicella aquatilis]